MYCRAGKDRHLMHGLNLSSESLAAHLRETWVTFHRPDHIGILDLTSDKLFKIAYSFIDFLAGVLAICTKRSGQPILLLAERSEYQGIVWTTQIWLSIAIVLDLLTN